MEKNLLTPKCFPLARRLKYLMPLCFAAAALAQAPAATGGKAPAALPDYPEDHRPPVAFHEDWKDATPGVPTDYHDRDLNAHLQNSNLQHGWYGKGAKDVQYVRHLGPKDDPGYIWLGSCADGPCAITLKDKSNYFDMTGLGKVVWRTKQGGFRQLRLILKLADGTWLVSDRYTGPADDWNIAELTIRDIRWRKLDINRITEDAWVEKPDLSKVDEIGFSDLMIGGPGFSSGTSRIDWMELQAKSVKRPTAPTQ